MNQETSESDHLFAEYGPSHTEMVGSAYKNLLLKINDPGLYEEESDREIDQQVEEAGAALPHELVEIANSVKALESAKSPGHEFSHSIDNLDSALRIMDEYPDIKDSEKVEIVLSCLGHDLGRHAQKGFTKSEWGIVDTILPAMVGKKLGKERGYHIPEKLLLRSLYSISSNGEPLTGRRAPDIVHQCDREQLIGSIMVPRGIAFDLLAQSNTTLFTDIDTLKKDYSKSLPVPETKEPRQWLMEQLFMMRNVYPPVSPDGKRIFDKKKEEQAVILMLAYAGNDEALNIIFTPELKKNEPNHQSLKPIPDEVYNSAKTKAQKVQDALRGYTPSKTDLIKLARKICMADGISIGGDFEEALAKKLPQSETAESEQERRNFGMVLQFAASTRHYQRQRDIARIESTDHSGVESGIAQLVRDDLISREEIFNQGDEH